MKYLLTSLLIAFTQVSAKTETKIKKTDTGYMMVLEEGENVLKEIEELARKEKIQGATVAAMGFVKARFGFFEADKKKYLEKQMPPMELVSFSGSIAWEKERPSLHAHGIVTGKDSCPWHRDRQRL